MSRTYHHHGREVYDSASDQARDVIDAMLDDPESRAWLAAEIAKREPVREISEALAAHKAECRRCYQGFYCADSRGL